MGRISGKEGRLYVGVTSGGTAEPIAFLNRWTIDQAFARFDATAWGDENEITTAGLPNARGEYGGWYDTATPQLLTAARDGDARKFYLYPTTDSTAEYFYGEAVFDYSAEVRHDATVSCSGTWSATSTVTPPTSKTS